MPDVTAVEKEVYNNVKDDGKKNQKHKSGVPITSSGKLCHAACRHICKLCISYKKITQQYKTLCTRAILPDISGAHERVHNRL